MYFYADRFLIQVLAFSLGPLIGLILTAVSSSVLGIIIGLVSFSAIFFQPYLSDLCLQNTAEGLKLVPIICAEGKVVYIGSNYNNIGKLFLNSENLVYVIDNQIDFYLPLSSIVTVKVEKMNESKAIEQLEKEYAPMLELKSPNLPQLVSLVGKISDQSTGCLMVKSKKNIFYNTYYFQVTYPFLWQKNIASRLKKDKISPHKKFNQNLSW